VDIDAVVAKYGWALQAVLPNGPGAPPFTYTIGLFDRLPELLCVGPLADVAGPTLNALAALLQRRPDLVRDGQRRSARWGRRAPDDHARPRRPLLARPLRRPGARLPPA
jgi:hypothetical protein